MSNVMLIPIQSTTGGLTGLENKGSSKKHSLPPSVCKNYLTLSFPLDHKTASSYFLEDETPGLTGKVESKNLVTLCNSVSSTERSEGRGHN